MFKEVFRSPMFWVALVVGIALIGAVSDNPTVLAVAVGLAWVGGQIQGSGTISCDECGASLEEEIEDSRL